MAGRFDIKSTSFLCSNENCDSRITQRLIEARTEDYTASGFWPGTADDNSFYLVCRRFLKLNFHLQHLSPSISFKAVLQSLSNLSEDCRRVNNMSKRLTIFTCPINCHFVSVRTRQLMQSMLRWRHENTNITSSALTLT